MKRALQLLTLSVAGLTGAHAAPPTNSAARERILLIDSSSMPVADGKATLIIGALQRTNGTYSGEYKIKVFPYFFKNEKGRLAIVVSDASLAAISEGKAAVIAGTATASRKGGKSRHIEATATPIDLNHGTLKLWFVAGERLMTFETAYHFVEECPAGLVATGTVNNIAKKFR
jgi:hypothetical protein